MSGGTQQYSRSAIQLGELLKMCPSIEPPVRSVCVACLKRKTKCHIACLSGPRVGGFQGTCWHACTFCKHGPLERLAAGCQNGSMAVETTAIGCHYSYIAELWFVKQTANSGEMGGLVLGQIFVQNLHAAYERVSARQARKLVASPRQQAYAQQGTT